MTRASESSIPPAPAADLRAFLESRPDIQTVEAFVTDVNGAARGKWLPRDKGLSLGEKGLPLPRSCFALDIWGRDVEAAGLAFGTGDPDGLCREIPGTACALPWAATPTAQVMLTMCDDDGAAFYAEPRGVLAGIDARLRRAGFHAVVATELEFYLTDSVHSPLDPLRPPHSGDDRWNRLQGQVLSVDALRRHETLLAEIAAACASQSIPADAMIRENGPGQYEINLRHVGEAVLAADHAILLKRVVKGVARRHGLAATFMAKPYGDQSGSGMHVHVSLLDGAGEPVFAMPGGEPSPSLHAAAAGLVATLPDIMLLLAPHANSYRRFRRNSHAPVKADWGEDDRSAAVRIIRGDRHLTRIEHRVAGADSNPYLVVAGILAGVLDGLTHRRVLQQTDRAGGTATALPSEWGSAIAQFASSAFVSEHFGSAFRDLFAACKRQDFDGMLARIPDVEYDAYRDIV